MNIEKVVTRFNQDMDGSMEPEESGEWVRFECLEELIQLVQAEEREACAKVCDRFAARQMHPAECASAIRAMVDK